MNKIFVTGYNGFIGSHLVPELQKKGFDVITDYRRLHTEKYVSLIHLASKNNIKNEFDADLIESNFILTREIFKVPTRIIYASSCVAAYPMNPYAYSKLYAEYLGAIHGNAVGLRLHNVYGANNNKGIVWWLMQQENGTHITIRGEQQVRDYIYVNDVVKEIIKTIPIGTGNCTGRKATVLWARENEISYEEAQEECNNGLGWHYHRKGILSNMAGVIDVGTGVATETMDLVNLYMKLSGKEFIINVEPAADYEPPVMISKRAVKHISLEEGLKKIINENINISS